MHPTAVRAILLERDEKRPTTFVGRDPFYGCVGFRLLSSKNNPAATATSPAPRAYIHQFPAAGFVLSTQTTVLRPGMLRLRSP